MQTQIDPLLKGLNAYVVGGAVRDTLLGLPCGDRDWVVVGSTPQELEKRGFLPVGADFPVFLHPQTKEEFALARTERKSGRGYKGFTFYAGSDVSLEQDLARRDLTVNAMAQRPDGQIVDPYGGREDLQNKQLRHVGVAFGEDPVRVLRLARFAARFTDFSVAPETMALCKEMVTDGEVDHLVPERVWQEVSRGLRSEQPSRMFAVLQACGALDVVLPGFVFDAMLARQLDEARRALAPSLPAMYALGMHKTSAHEALAKRLRAPTECAQWARLLPVILAGMQEVSDDPRWDLADIEAAFALIERADGLRRPQRLLELLSLASWMLGQTSQPWVSVLQTAREVDAGAVAASLRDQGGPAIAAAVREARLRAVSEQMASIGASKAAQ